MKIDQNIKERWVKALRDQKLPKHREGMRSLKTGAMDVLGVLCDVLKETSKAHWENESFIYRGKPHIYVPPLSYSLMMGLSHERIENASILFNGSKVPLFRLNDDTNLTLSEIANLIEEQL